MPDQVTLADNPLLDFSGLPRFNEVTPEHVSPAVDAVLAEIRNTVATLTADTTPPTWQSFIDPLFAANEKLERTWSQVGHLNAVVNSPALRDAYNENLPKVTELSTELSQNPALYARYKALRASPEFAGLNPGQQKLIDDELRDFRLGGAELPEADKPRFKALQEEMAALSAKFEENVLDATNAFALYVEQESELSGIPGDVLAAAREAAEADGKPGWKFTLRMPSYLPVMQYAANRKLRETLYHAYCTRASEFGPAELDNTANIDRLLALRQEEAGLLGYKNFAEVSLAPKMADTPEQVLEFLRNMAVKSKPYAERDMEELRAFAREQLGLEDLQAWDVAYASEKLREQRYAFSDNEVKQYLPENRVLAGLFKVVETIFEVAIVESQAGTWHPDVRFFNITDRAGRLVGQFYLDLYARENKRGGAWMDIAINRKRTADGIQTPVAYLTCNFSRPVGDKPALFTHDEVITLFHEFGHGLHLLLTQVDTLGVSGLDGVEWDAVELPSQFMENFCWEWDVLKHMTSHVDTGEPLPRELFDKMLAAKNFQAGMMFVRQLEFGLFDFYLHHSYDAQRDTVLGVANQVRQEVAVVMPPSYNRYPMSFAHIFAGGYAAGYYSYKWAEVLSADAYSLFEEMAQSTGTVLVPEAGRKFRDEVLGRGGSRPALQSFVAFRGREPSIEALFRHNGMN